MEINLHLHGIYSTTWGTTTKDCQMHQIICGDVIPASEYIWIDTPQNVQLQRSSANHFITVSQCISLPHSRETEGEGTERSSFLKLVGDYWIWYLRQQEAGLFSTVFLNFCGLAVLTRGSVSYFNHDTVLATREDSPAHVLRSACVSSCWAKHYISCTFNVMGNWPQ